MILSPRQAAFAWNAAGGQTGRAVEFTAIAVAESSLDTNAISPAGALGLWQIMPANFAPLGVDQGQWYVPVVNARAAVLLSGRGSNCAAWDTAYANIGRSGRYRFLGWPERGSAAWNNLSYVAAHLGGTITPPPGAAPALTVGGQDVDPALTAAVDQLSHLIGYAIPAATAQIAAAGRQAASLTRRLPRLG